MEKNNDENRKINKLNIIRYIIGIIFILGGLGGLTTGESLLGGLATIMLGVSFFPILYKLLKCSNNKLLQIIIPIILLFIAFALMPKDNTVTNVNSTNIVSDKSVENINDNYLNNITNKLNNIDSNSSQIENKIENASGDKIDNK